MRLDPCVKGLLTGDCPVAVNTVTIAKEACDGIQIPGVNGALALTLAILQVVETVKSNKAECNSIASRVSTIAVAIAGMVRGHEDHMDAILERNLLRFNSTLQDIVTFMKSQADLPLRSRFWRRAEIKASMQEQFVKLNDAWSIFQTALDINLQHQLTLVRRAMLREEKDGNGYRYLQRADIHVLRNIQRYTDVRGETVEEDEAEVEGRVVVVRRSTAYRDFKTLQENLTAVRQLWSPRVEQLFGYSRRDSDIMFAVVLSSRGQHPVSFYLDQLSPQERFKTSIRLALEMTDSRRYLWDNGFYESSGGFSSMLITESGHIASVSGHGLKRVTSWHDKDWDGSKPFVNLFRFFRGDRRHDIINSVLTNMRSDFSLDRQLDTVRFFDSHLRTVADWSSINDIDYHLLLRAWASVHLPWRSFEASQDLEIGDVGYWVPQKFSAPTFVKLLNVAHEFGDCISLGWEMIWQVRQPLQVDESDGTTRYVFPLSEGCYDWLCFHRETVHRIASEADAVYWLLQNGPAISEEYFVVLQRLVVVTGKGTFSKIQIELSADFGDKIYFYDDAPLPELDVDRANVFMYGPNSMQDSAHNMAYWSLDPKRGTPIPRGHNYWLATITIVRASPALDLPRILSEIRRKPIVQYVNLSDLEADLGKLPGAPSARRI